MSDVLTAEQRRRNMSSVKGKNSRPEMLVRRHVHSLGFRFRLHRRNLPGCPDIILPRHKKIIFVHGCFWHVHKCKYGMVKPATNSEFWATKRRSNVLRDRKNLKLLTHQGWKVLVIWECETRDPKSLSTTIRRFLPKRRL